MLLAPTHLETRSLMHASSFAPLDTQSQNNETILHRAI